MQKSLLTLFCALCALFFIPVSVQATVLLNEHFNQATETLATNDNAFAGEIAATGWTNINGSGQIYMSSTNLSYSGYKTTADTEGGSAEYKTTFGKKAAARLSNSVKSGSVFAAAIMDISAFSGTSSAREYIFSLCPGVSGLATAASTHFARLYMRAGSESGFRFAIAKGAEANTLFLRWSNDLAFGKYLVVVEYEFVSGDNNDIVRLYLNPVKSDTKPANASLTCVQDTIRESDSKNYGASQAIDVPVGEGDPGISSVMLFSSGSDKAAMLIDELKVVTDWADLWEAGGEPEQDPIAQPSPSASSITLSSATISWSAVDGADSYVLQWKVNGGSYSEDIEIDKDDRSYSMSDLESETKYYVRVKTVIGEDASEWKEINFTTLAEDATMEYKDITFDKYSATNAMPTSGTVYLAHNILDYNDATLTGDLTLNLHGKELYMFGTHIIVPNGKTLTIYDDAGDGLIKGGYAGTFLDKALISVKDGGTLIIGEGAVVNLSDGADYNAAIDIASGGTLKLSGAPTISGVTTDIYLNSNEITIESGKPLTNTTPYKVFRLAGVFTDGWANMGGEKPSDYFVSSSSNRGVCLGVSGEGQMVSAFSLSESSNNSDISTYSGTLSNISFTRSIITRAHYNTLCLPFALDDDQLEEIFGAGYDLREFESSSLDGEVLSLTFSDPLDALEAGKPYLLQPSVDVVNPSFEGVTIEATSPVDQTSDANISFHGTFNPTELAGGNKNLLFLGADNELFWPEATGNLKGFRAYFEVKGGAALAAKRARIVKKEDSATGIETVESRKTKVESSKVLRNGQLLILRDNKTYNVIGQMVK